MSTGASTTDHADLGRRLRALRHRAGLSQEALAHRAGVSVRALADLERGRSRGPQRRTVEMLADALGLNAAEAAELERLAGLGRPRPRPAGDHTPHALALPRDVGDFTARDRALAELLALAEHIDPAHPPVTVVSGQPGLGKTAFAVHAAHTLAPHFPDGLFAVDLDGMAPEPTAPRDALGRLLRALGVADRTVPAGTDERSALFRSVVRDRRILLVLDNAVDEDQVRPLLPATGPSLTIVTSRRDLSGLEAVHRTGLDVLRREEAVRLLTLIIGPERVAAEQQAARDLAELCGRLPLAVRIAGQRLAARPTERIGKLVTQLAARGRRLDLLQAGGLQVRAAFSLSYERLDPATRLLFRRAALAAGPDVSPEIAARLANLTDDQAWRGAEELTGAGLLQAHPTAERYRFHDLLRLFATEQVEAEDPPAAIEAARDRTADWVLRRAAAAALRFDADRHQDAPDDDPDPQAAPADREEARAWLEAERTEWLAALRRARATGRHRQVVDAAEAMHWFSDLNPEWGELWVEVFGHSVASARALGSRPEEVVHLNYLAWANNVCVFDHAAGLVAADAALAVAREIGDEVQEGWALGYGAGSLHRLGRAEESIRRFQESVACLGRQYTPQAALGELTVLYTLGQILRQVGRTEEALAVHRRAEAKCRSGVPGQSPELIAQYQAMSQQQVGNSLAALGRWAEAEESLRRSMDYFDAARMPARAAPTRLDLGILLRRLDRLAEAREAVTAAHEELRAMGHPRLPEAVAELRALDPAAGGRAAG
ncbi:helix-turn-helix domain-containing protein [Kitasatospora camelliae]|uniref:Helix-turn-helix domain-containing protein n=1 Tax=Kitasatospora camelliae TaxID=3156397 RepID=A0AAU8JPK2_9ACTN